MKKFFTIIVTMLVASSVWAQDYDFEVDGIYYDIIGENSVSVTYGSYPYYGEGAGYSGNVVIPISVSYGGKTYNVTSLGMACFGNCHELTSVTIPNSITVVGEDCFIGCDALSSLVVPDDLNLGYSHLFFEINNICYHVKNGKEVSVSQNTKKKLQGDIEIPSEVFYYGRTFQVTSIDGGAFYECTELTSIVIPNSVTSISIEVFNGCTNLTSYVGPVPSHYNPNPLLEYVKITKGCLAEYFTFSQNLKTIDLSELECTELTSDYHFYKSHNIESIIIPEKMDVSRAELYFVKDGIRYKVLNGKEVAVVKNGYYDDYEFHNTFYSGDIIIPNTITAGNTFNVISIEDNAFENCSNVTSISIPNSVTSVKYAFRGCTGLSSIIIPDELDLSRSGLQFKNNNIWYKVLNNTSVAVTSSSSEEDYSGEIIIPSTVTGLGYTFSVTTIGYAFDDCKNLVAITIPASVSNIYDEAFYGCTNLKKVTCYATNPPEAYKNSFENYNGYLYIPFTSKDKYKESACWGLFKNIEYIDNQGGEQGGEGGNQTAINSVSNATAVTIANNQILVTGEAPAFVVTVSGQKIANQNLKSGVYFVNVEGEIVKVVK